MSDNDSPSDSLSDSDDNGPQLPVQAGPMGTEEGGELDQMMEGIDPQEDAAAAAVAARNLKDAEENAAVNARNAAANAAAEAKEKEVQEGRDFVVAAAMARRAAAQAQPPAVAPPVVAAPAAAPAADDGPDGIALREPGSDTSESDSDLEDYGGLPAFNQNPNRMTNEEALKRAEDEAKERGHAMDEDEGEEEDSDDLKDPSGLGGGDDPGPAHTGNGDDANAEYTVMVVHGPVAADERLSDLQQERVDREVDKLVNAKKESKKRTTAEEEQKMRAEAEAATKDWVVRCFNERLPPYKKAARKLDKDERKRHESQQRNAAIAFNSCEVRVRQAMWSEPEQDREFQDLAARVNHWTTLDRVGDVEQQLRYEYACFMREERCRILQVIQAARAQKVTCEEAERRLAQEEEDRYMQDVLAEEEEEVLPECDEPLRLQVDPERRRPPVKEPVKETLKEYTARLKEYLNKLAGASSKGRSTKQKTLPPDLRNLQDCDPCEVWRVRKWPWLATDKAEENEIRQSPEYLIAMNRLVDLKAELNMGNTSIGTWSSEFENAFDNDQLARTVTWAEIDALKLEQAYGCSGSNMAKVKTEAEKQVKAATKAAGKQLAGSSRGKKKEGVRVLDLIMACRADHDPLKSGNNTGTHFLQTEMLRCFPEKMPGGDSWEINPLIEFLCWYKQHILARAAATQSSVRLDKQEDGEARSQTRQQALFFSAVCAPMLVSRSSDKARREAAQQARKGVDLEPETDQAMVMCDAIYDRYDAINRTVKRAFEGLLADTASPTPLLRDLVDQATYARWMVMVNGAT